MNPGEKKKETTTDPVTNVKTTTTTILKKPVEMRSYLKVKRTEFKGYIYQGLGKCRYGEFMEFGEDSGANDGTPAKDPITLMECKQECDKQTECRYFSFSGNEGANICNLYSY